MTNTMQMVCQAYITHRAASGSLVENLRETVIPNAPRHVPLASVESPRVPTFAIHSREKRFGFGAAYPERKLSGLNTNNGSSASICLLSDTRCPYAPSNTPRTKVEE